jgi:hypothetical protein
MRWPTSLLACHGGKGSCAFSCARSVSPGVCAEPGSACLRASTPPSIEFQIAQSHGPLRRTPSFVSSRVSRPPAPQTAPVPAGAQAASTARLCELPHTRNSRLLLTFGSRALHPIRVTARRPDFPSPYPKRGRAASLRALTMPHLRFNADASTLLAQYEARALLLRRGTAERATATREAIAQSLAHIARIGECDAKFAADAVRMGWLWPLT